MSQDCSDDVPLRKWGDIASDVSDAPACIEQCRQDFIRRLIPDRNATFTEVCDFLRSGENKDDTDGRRMRELYCCDSVLCGVVVQEQGQDPNVAWIINRCQKQSSQGHGLIYDPGPLAVGESCPVDSIYRLGEPRPCEGLEPTPSNVSSTLVSTYTSTTISPTSTPTAEPAPSSGLPRSTKVAIVVVAVIGSLLLTAILLAFWLRRRRPRQPDLSKGEKSVEVLATSAAPGSAVSLVAYRLPRPTSQTYIWHGHQEVVTSDDEDDNEDDAKMATFARDAKFDKSKYHSIQTVASVSSQPSHLLTPTSSYRPSSSPLTPPPPLAERRLLSTLAVPPPISPVSPTSPMSPVSPSLLSSAANSVRSGAGNPSTIDGKHNHNHPHTQQQSQRESVSTFSSSFYHHHCRSPSDGPFPPSPICAPTTNKLEPREERAPQASRTPPLVAFFSTAVGKKKGAW